MTFLGDLYWVISAVMIKLGLSYIGYHQYFKYCKSTIGNVRPWYGQGMYAIVWSGKRLWNLFPYICRGQLIHLLKPIFAQLNWSLKSNLTLDLLMISYSIWQLNLFYIVFFFAWFNTCTVCYHHNNLFWMTLAMLCWKYTFHIYD